MSDLGFFIGVGGGFAVLAIGALLRDRQRRDAAAATGLAPAALDVLPASLMATALWRLADGGFPTGGLVGAMHRGSVDIAVTAFELETLRERRGEWAVLPVDAPFRIDGHVRVVFFQIARRFPHTLLKRAGPSDALPERTALERAGNLAATARALLGAPDRVESERPPGLPPAPLELALPVGWRAYGADPVFAAELMREPLVSTLDDEGAADEVIELIDDLIVVYFARADAARELGDAGAVPWPRMAQYLVDDGLQIVDAIARVTATRDPRGVHAG